MVALSAPKMVGHTKNRHLIFCPGSFLPLLKKNSLKPVFLLQLQMEINLVAHQKNHDHLTKLAFLQTPLAPVINA